MGMLDEVIARSSFMEAERDEWRSRAEKAEAALEALKDSKRPIFDEKSIAQHLARLEDQSIRASLRQEVCGLWARIAVLEVQAREARVQSIRNDGNDKRGS